MSVAVPAALIDLARETREASRRLAALDAAARNQALEAIATALETHSAAILEANRRDCEQAQQDGIAAALYARLKLDAAKLQGAIAGVRDVARLADPLGQRQLHRELDQGLVLERLTVPVGVLGVIFEARPDAVMQIAALAIKSGNGAILKGGREAVESCRAILAAIREGLAGSAVDPNVLQLLTSREETLALLQLDQYVDLIIPRGSNSFVRFVQDNTRIPVLGHADGICHLYVDAAADLDLATTVAVDAKTQYPAACNAIETLLVHRDVAADFLARVGPALEAKEVQLRGDAEARELWPMAEATEEDWSTEYSDLILAVKLVASLEEAIAHINRYGSRHTDGIITRDDAAAARFQSLVDSAGVYRNCSTRFADGFRYGFGAEVGISTQKLPPRGPVGLEGLVTYKYLLNGDGHVAATYAGANPKPFTHRDL